MMGFAFADYKAALEGADLKQKEIIMDRAALDPNISLIQLIELQAFAFPDLVKILVL